ncbi:MAG: LLM class flavin-dependent oxidoreductase [Nostocoides sp.]
MRLSIWPGLDQPWHDVLDLARFADRAGWDTLYVEDHFIGHPASSERDPLLEATASLSAIAAATDRIRLGTLVLSVTYRHPAVIANWAATLDHVSGGRLTLGLGAGWRESEHTAYGLPLGRPGARVDRFVEGLQVVRGLLESERTTVEGRYYQVRDAVSEPKPIQAKVPILVGAKQNRMLGVVARYADGWNMWSTPATLAERAAVLDAHCGRIGRDPASIARSTQALLRITDDPAAAERFVASNAPRPCLAGSTDMVADAIGSYAAVGVDEFIVVDSDCGTGAQREDTLSALRAAVLERLV